MERYGELRPFAASRMNGHGATGLAAVPPDKRKGFAYPASLKSSRRLRLHTGGVASMVLLAARRKGTAISAHRAAQPQESRQSRKTRTAKT